jgi:hypothetical protein
MQGRQIERITYLKVRGAFTPSRRRDDFSGDGPMAVTAQRPGPIGPASP